MSGDRVADFTLGEELGRHWSRIAVRRARSPRYPGRELVVRTAPARGGPDPDHGVFEASDQGAAAAEYVARMEAACAWAGPGLVPWLEAGLDAERGLVYLVRPYCQGRLAERYPPGGRRAAPGLIAALREVAAGVRRVWAAGVAARWPAAKGVLGRPDLGLRVHDLLVDMDRAQLSDWLTDPLRRMVLAGDPGPHQTDLLDPQGCAPSVLLERPLLDEAGLTRELAFVYHVLRTGDFPFPVDGAIDVLRGLHGQGVEAAGLELAAERALVVRALGGKGSWRSADELLEELAAV